MTTEISSKPLRHFWDSVPHGFWFKQGYEDLLNQLSTTKPSQWVEIGVYHGASLGWLGVETVNRNLPITLHAVDDFSQVDRAVFKHNIADVAARLGARLQLHEGDSSTQAKDFKPNSVDVIWVDADHSYEGVKKDIAAFWPKLKPGGWMGGDDHMPEYAGVEQAVNEFFGPLGIEVQVRPGAMGTRQWDYWLVQKPK